jgi:hypothetical protein
MELIRQLMAGHEFDSERSFTVILYQQAVELGRAKI